MFLSIFKAGDTSDRSPWGDFWFQPVSRIGAGGVRVSADSALTLTTVYACVRVLSQSFAVLPFRLYRPRTGGGRQLVTDHWLYRLFVRRPNRWQTPYQWRQMMQGHLELRGNAFNRIVDDGAGGVLELQPLHPDRVAIELLGEMDYRYRYTRRDGSTETLRRDQVWHLRGLAADHYVGYNPIEIARGAIGEALQFQQYSSQFFANNATPPMWIKYPGSIADAATRQTLQESIQKATGGANRGKTMVLDRGMELNALSVNLKDMQFLEARAAKVSEVARLFGVPPHKIGDLSKATFSNIEQQAIEFWTDSMQPRCESWESSIECDLLGENTDLEIEFDMRAQMRGDSVARAQYIHNLVLDGVITRNEGRTMEGLDPIEGLDVPLVPGNERELDDPDPNGKAGPGKALPDAAPTDADEDGAGARAPAPTDRLAAVLQSNAQRLAHRIVAARGKLPGAALIAEALAVPEPAAAAWAARHQGAEWTEAALLRSLLDLGNPA